MPPAAVIAALVLHTSMPAAIPSQQPASLRGTVTRAGDAIPLPGIQVSLQGHTLTATTGIGGAYTLYGVPSGEQVVVFQGLGSQRREVRVTIVAAGTMVLDVALEPEAVRLTEIVVEGVSRVPERLVEAPAAAAVIERSTMFDYSVTGQAPSVFLRVPGVDVVQSGVNDFNVNTRGFNSSLTRRMLVLQDGRDTSVPLLGFQEWNALAVPLADMGAIELIRGPGSALYGANAFNGVINIRTPPARDVVGTRIMIGGGELESLHGDVRHAGVLAAGRYGYKLNLGYNRSATWTRSRTSFDRGDLRREYADATDADVPDFREAVPVAGQRIDPATGRPLGEPDPVTSTYGSARVDHYARDGSVATVEAGASVAAKHTVVSGLGRIQIDEVLRPWARFAFGRDDLHLMAWYSGRDTRGEPHVSLGSGAQILDESAVLHAEAQTNRSFARDRGRFVVGVSGRNTRTDTKLTLFPPEEDARSDWSYAGYGQLAFELSSALTIVGAVRVDEGTLFEPQLSPRVALVVAPNDRQSLRFTVNRAFQTPTQLERFLRFTAAAPADFRNLETGLRASPLGPRLDSVPTGTLFTNSAAVPVLALGNTDLAVERITSYEIGYKAQLGAVYFSADAYYSRMRDFVTDLLPGANPAFAAWTAPAAVPMSARPILEGAVRDALRGAGQHLAAAGLTRLVDGTTAIVVSYANAGQAETYGLEIGGSARPSPDWSIDLAYAFFGFAVDPKSVLPGDELKPNTPRHRGSLGASHRSRRGWEGAIHVYVTEGFDWATGVFSGRVPSRQTVDARLGYRIDTNLRVHVLATNLFDQERYHIFGGSLVGRRVLAALTFAF